MLPNLKVLRKKAGISQQTLADAIGASQQSINQYENHAIEPDIATLCSIANYFHTSIDYLVGRIDETEEKETKPYLLTPGEISHIDHYRVLKKSEQQCVDLVIKTIMDK